MAFNVTLYPSFSKPKNSTKIPSGGETFPCLMVEPCGVINPRISFNQGNNWNPSSYNYAYIPDFGRYYWVVEWTFERGRWYVTLSVDALASWKNNILSETEYVVRSASSVTPTVIDNLYPALQSFSFTNSDKQIWPVKTLASGCYVVGILGGGDGTTGGVSYYIANGKLLQNLMNAIMLSPSWMGVPEEISEDLMKCLVNPLQYLTSVMWFPIDADSWGNSASVPYVGWWKPNVGLLDYGGDYVLEGTLGTRASHPQAGSNRTYLNYSPYTRVSAYIPPFGTITLNPDQFPPNKSIPYRIVVDGISGMGYLEIAGEGGAIYMSAKVGVDLSVGQETSNSGTMAGTVLGSVGSSPLLNSHPFDKAVGAVFSGIGDVLSVLNPQFTNIMQSSGTSAYVYNAYLVQEFVNTVSTDNEHLGSPLCKNVLLSSLSGFTQCLDPDVNIPCTDAEHDMIASYMSGGFYIE